jgi:hypothetical protein
MGTEAHSSITLQLPLQSEISNQPFTRLATCIHTGILLGLFNPEDGGDMFLQNVCWHLLDYVTLCPRRLYSSVEKWFMLCIIPQGTCIKYKTKEKIKEK